MTENGRLNPSDHLIDLNGKDYLPVAWRIAWLRDLQPSASLETEMVKHEVGQAIFKAKVTLPDGGSATGWGSETADDFGDFIEKAETKAIGRALAALGFGTQFCVDFDEGGAVTDAPVQRAPARASAAVRSPAKSATTTGRVMPLLYAGDCTDCGYRIAKGTTAIYDGNTKTVRHQQGECPSGGGSQYTDAQT